jgi:hypothetical protein
MMEATQTIIFNVPSRQAPGFVRRQSRMIEMMRMRNVIADLRNNPNPTEHELNSFSTIWEQVIQFMADYVEAPTREIAVELIRDASEEQFEQMFDALGGASKEVPPEAPSKPKSGNSGKRAKGPKA